MISLAYGIENLTVLNVPFLGTNSIAVLYFIYVYVINPITQNYSY